MRTKYLLSGYGIAIGIFFITTAGYGQAVLDIKGKALSLSPGALLHVNGSIQFDSGKVVNSGYLELTGDWFNNDPRSSVFDPAGKGWVNLAGGLQSIEGNPTSFPNLALGGTEAKQLVATTTVNDSLDIEDKELALDGYDLLVAGTGEGAIQRTTGYINSTSDRRGHVLRAVTSGNSYTFPLGGGYPFRYRPLTATPGSDGVIAAQFQNYDPNTDGYDRSKTIGDIRNVNSFFYHTAGWRSGAGSIKVSIPYNSDQDSLHSGLASWSVAESGWRLTGQFREYSAAGEGTDRIAEGIVQDTGMQALGLVHYIDNTRIFIVTAFTPNGDGLNDAFVIKGLENYRTNSVEIFNRWGQMVYSKVGYTNDWKGDGRDIGTYMYKVWLVDMEGGEHIYKGDVTLIR